MPPRKPPTVPIAVVDTQVKDDFVKEIAGVEIRLPSLSYLKPGLIRKLRRLGQLDATYTLMELVLSEEQLEALDDMDPEEYAELMDEWREHSGVSLGESKASTS